MSARPILDLRAQILANCKYLFPGRNIELVTGSAPTGSGTAYVVDLDPDLIEKKAVKPGVLLTAKTESDELGMALFVMLKQTKDMIGERISGHVSVVRARAERFGE